MEAAGWLAPGAVFIEVVMVTLVAEIERGMRAGDPALWMAGRVVSYGALFERVDRLAGRLRKWSGWGAAAVPRIGLLAPNGPGYVAAALAVMKAGGCLVPVPGELTEAERAELARVTALHGVLVLGSHAWAGAGVELDPETGMRGHACEARRPGFPEDEFEALGPAMIRLSSGTTGRSKGVVLSHRALRERTEAANEGLRIGPADRVLWAMSMAHHFAVSIMLYLRCGAMTVIENSVLAEEVLATAAASEATVWYGAPFHHALLAADGGKFAWRSLRMAVSTAAGLPAETARAFHERFQKPLVQALGVIECGLPLINLENPADHPESVGRPVGGWEMALRDEAGEEAGPGETGELCLRGPGMFDAYLDPWKRRAEVLDDGWFRTGDLCDRDADGLVRIRGRCKSVINVGGLKVFPEEVEAVLDRDRTVLRSRVTAREDPDFGAVPCAEVVAANGERPDPRKLRAACRKVLAPHKVPVAVTVVEALPLTASGKLQR